MNAPDLPRFTITPGFTDAKRELAADPLLMDGICVSTQARGMGLGTALSKAIKDEAARQGLSAVRLDVIDNNPRARALYEREGFEAMGTETLGPFAVIFGLKSATNMRWAAPA